MAVILLSGTNQANAQGTFENLNFEEANPAPGSIPGDVTVASALPDWTVAIGGVQQSQIPENTFSLGAPSVILEGLESPVPPIDGDYSVYLKGTSSSVEISQTGLIPAGTQSLFFEGEQAVVSQGNGTLAVMIGNQTVPFTSIAADGNYTLYGANISAWSGQTESLTFFALMDFAAPNNWELDDISFSPVAIVPEPSPVALAGIGTILFALYRRWDTMRQ
jgi:hypothetical protein